MGVNGLLQMVKEIQQPVNLLKYKGKTLAVDTYGWLHRGLISCAQELCQDVPTKKYINSVMKKVDMLRYFGVEPYLVFDGSYLPTKADTALERRKKRQEAQAKADLYTKQGKRSLAFKEFMKAASVTPEMAKSIMVELDLRKVKYVVAPYEADPQMVYLEAIGAVDGIILEDSDLLVFGCQTLITKLNDFGDCVEISRTDFDKVSKIRSLGSITQEQLRLVAILSGCDYTKGVPGIGLITAFLLISKYNHFDRVINYLKNEGKPVTREYEEEAHRADIAFQYQKVFNPIEQKVTTLNEEPLQCDRDFYDSCCGATLEHTLHVNICRGRIHPNTHAPLIAREMSLGITKSASVNQRPPAEPQVASRSRSNPQRGIESFFNTRVKQSISAENAARVPLQSKDMNIPISRKVTTGKVMSPNSKKIKAFAGKHYDTTTKLELKGATKLEATEPKIETIEHKEITMTIKNNMVSRKVPNWDISGDLDVPDDMSSSPVKQCVVERAPVFKHEPIIQDEEEVLDESPVRKREFSLLAQSLHERFLMKKGAKLMRVEKKSELEVSASQSLQRKEKKVVIEEEPQNTHTPILESVARVQIRLGLHQFAFRG